jgi:hypothetical protein
MLVGGIVGYWHRQTKTPLREKQEKELQDLAVIHGTYKVAYALKFYAKEGRRQRISFADFKNWFERVAEDLPPDIVCGAYLTGDSRLIEAADEYETLSSAWFPDSKTVARMEYLETYLKQLLSVWRI